MYLKDLITKLRLEIPKYSEKYSTKLTISTISSIAGLVTVKTSSAHNLQANEIINVIGTTKKTAITSIITSNDIATLTTTTNHDQTLDYVDSDDQPPITIAECSIVNYNGSHTLSDVISRKVLKFNKTGSPADASDGFLLENINIGFNGLYTVNTIIDSTTFTYILNTSLTATGDGGYVHSDMRISGDVDIERFVNSGYSKQTTDKYWICIVPESTTASKSRHVESDATAQHTQGDDFRQRLLPVVGFYLFIPNNNKLSGRSAYDSALDESVNLFASILGFFVSSPYNDNFQSRLIIESHEPYLYNTSFYVHKFTFSAAFDLSDNDIVTTKSDVAFRDISLSEINENDETIMSTDIELDN